MTVTSDQERRGAEQWFRRRGLPAVVRGRSGHIVVRTLPAGAWLAARQTRHWVLHMAGFLPAVLLTACYMTVEPVVASRLQGASVLLGVVGNLVVVGVLYVFTATGAGSIFCWALRAALRQLRGIGMMTSRSLPLLLLVTTFGFFTAEIWQAVGALPNNRPMSRSSPRRHSPVPNARTWSSSCC